MRVTDGALFRQFLAGLGAARRESADALASLADGKRVRLASDDPAGAHTALVQRARLARLEGLDRSAGAARTDLATLDQVLGRVVNLVSEAQIEALAGASFGFDIANEARAEVVERLREELLALANTSQSGRYLFGGTETLTVPFAADGSYAGNDAESLASIDSDQQVGATLSGRRVFLDGQDLFVLLDDLAQALRDNRTTDVAASLPGLETELNRLVEIRADVGQRLRQVDTSVDRHLDESLELLRRISEIEDVDLSRVIVDLQASSLTTEALSAAAARVLGRSLFDFLG